MRRTAFWVGDWQLRGEHAVWEGVCVCVCVRVCVCGDQSLVWLQNQRNYTSLNIIWHTAHMKH